MGLNPAGVTKEEGADQIYLSLLFFFLCNSARGREGMDEVNPAGVTKERSQDESSLSVLASFFCVTQPVAGRMLSLISVHTKKEDMSHDISSAHLLKLN